MSNNQSNELREQVTKLVWGGRTDVDGILALNQHALKVALELIGNVEKGAITNRKYKFVEELRQAFNKYYGGEK